METVVKVPILDNCSSAVARKFSIDRARVEAEALEMVPVAR